jgi:hypothetical protein
LRYRATKSIFEITGNIRVLFLSRVRLVHAWCVALCTLPYDNTLCWANFEFLIEIVTNFLPFFFSEIRCLARGLLNCFVQVTFCTSYILYKLYSVKVTFCTNYILYKLHSVQVTFSISYILYKLYSVQVTFCTSYILYNLHSVQVTFCTSYILYKLYSVQVTFCTSYILYNLHSVQVIFCTSYILYNLHSVQVTFCTRLCATIYVVCLYARVACICFETF